MTLKEAIIILDDILENYSFASKEAAALMLAVEVLEYHLNERGDEV